MIGEDYQSRKDMSRFAGSKDHFDSYRSAAVDAERIRQGLRFVSDYPPEEEVFTADEVITIHNFAVDPSGRYWLVKNALKEPPKEKDVDQEMAYELGTELGFGLTETRIVELEETKRFASRWLPNAAYKWWMFEHEVPEGTRKTVEDELSHLWPFMYFMNFTGDSMQFVFTPKGHVALVDYFPLMLSYSRDQPEAGRVGPTSIRCVDAQRSRIFDYVHFYMNQDRSLNPELIEEGVEKIAGLKTGRLEEAARQLPERIDWGGLVEDYRGEALRNMLWRRDNIRDVFRHVIGFRVDSTKMLRTFYDLDEKWQPAGSDR